MQLKWVLLITSSFILNLIIMINLYDWLFNSYNGMRFSILFQILSRHIYILNGHINICFWVLKVVMLNWIFMLLNTWLVFYSSEVFSEIVWEEFFKSWVLALWLSHHFFFHPLIWYYLLLSMLLILNQYLYLILIFIKILGLYILIHL